MDQRWACPSGHRGLPAQPFVVGDEQVRAGCRCTGKLDGVRRPNRPIPADFREPGSGAQVERQHRCARPDRLPVAAHQVFVSGFHRLDENLAEGERGGERLVVSFDHAAAQRRDPLRAFAPVLDEVHEEVRIPEDPAHPHPSRSRSTQASASSSARSSLPRPRRERMGSASRHPPPAYSLRYHSISPRQAGGSRHRAGGPSPICGGDGRGLRAGTGGDAPSRSRTAHQVTSRIGRLVGDAVQAGVDLDPGAQGAIGDLLGLGLPDDLTDREVIPVRVPAVQECGRDPHFIGYPGLRASVHMPCLAAEPGVRGFPSHLSGTGRTPGGHLPSAATPAASRP